MSQKLDKRLLEEFGAVAAAKEELQIRAGISIKNSKPLNNNSWTSKVVAAINISDLAQEHGIEKCPLCNYGISFDDSRGWFICLNAKYNHKCSFKGNIVDFMERCI